MRIAAIVIVLLAAEPAVAAETATYTFDALGRLTQSTYVGGPRDAGQATLNYDPAGNRTQYAFGVGGPPPPPPPPPPGMTAINPSETLAGQITYVFQPTKFEQNGVGPTIQSFVVPSGEGSAVIASGGASVSYTTPAANVGSDGCTTGAKQIFSISAGIRDSGGNSVTSSYTVTINGLKGHGVCQ